ncbi:MAG TPA: iron dependent repressor, metal binding and dimerization domain protein [Vicinamibacterales bacterium]|nr:iron dependent repressor, metal binding and dimerization domain protein [Vicinamibacterales bacterium]
MLPSHTVENYLKAIFQAQTLLPSQDALVPMGHLASALGVVPGTATTMVKGLSESGLVRYEPYAGVRLTAAGEKLAALVLRRHRLIELFLVKVMGMSWAEVHDEAEHLEHAVSDRLIDRIDEMLGRPAVDPHGDPIPDSQGTVSLPEYETLLTCPLRERVTVKRVSDQDSEFLRFVERHDLKPGQMVSVEERDAAADSVRLRGPADREITIGARAASKVLVEVVQVLLLVLLGAISAAAQATPADPPGPEPFAIVDNSFLVEEAFNQETNIFQNIFGTVRVGGSWAAGFTQEWPVASQTHQLSYTLAWQDADGDTGFSDTLINYRWQAWMEGPGRPAFSPRISAVLPTGSVSRGLGDGSFGLQANLPFSKQRGDVYWHWNAGVTWLPRADVELTEPTGEQLPAESNTHASLVSPFLAGSAIYRLQPMLNLMLESVLSFDEFTTGAGTARETSFTLAPGARGGWNVGDQQLILGFAVPVTWAGGDSDTGAFVYLSYELPFRK